MSGRSFTTNGIVGGARTSRGFTLIELVVSMAVMVILLGGISSAMMLSAYAIEDETSPLMIQAEAGKALDQISTELTYALSITSQTSTSIEFTVADRDGDDSPEIIKYSWSGTSGDALVRQYNGGTEISVVDKVQSLTISYDRAESAGFLPPEQSESGEEIIYGFGGDNYDVREYTIQEDRWPGEILYYDFPDNAVSWKITRVYVQAEKTNNGEGKTLVQIRRLNWSDLPNSPVIEEKLMYEPDLPSSMEWQTFYYDNAGGLDPDQTYALVLQFEDNGYAARVQYQDSGVSNNGNMLSVWDNGTDWSRRYSSKGLLAYVVGTITTEGDPIPSSRYYLRSVTFTIEAGETDTSDMHATINTLNMPEVTAP